MFPNSNDGITETVAVYAKECKQLPIKTQSGRSSNPTSMKGNYLGFATNRNNDGRDILCVIRC